VPRSLAVNSKLLHVRFDSDVHQLLRRFVHGVFLFAAGDYVIFFKVAGGAASTGAGTYPNDNVGVAAPEKPILDELIAEQNSRKLGVPQWRFFAG
jgi:hypothetical protein